MFDDDDDNNGIAFMWRVKVRGVVQEGAAPISICSRWSRCVVQFGVTCTDESHLAGPFSGF